MKTFNVVISHLVEELQSATYKVDAESFEEAKALGYEMADEDGYIWAEVDVIEDTETGERKEYSE